MTNLSPSTEGGPAQQVSPAPGQGSGALWQGRLAESYPLVIVIAVLILVLGLSVLFVHPRRRLAGYGNFNHLLHVADVQAVPGDFRPVDIYGQVGLPGNLLRIEIGSAMDGGEHPGDFCRLFAEDAQIVAKELYDQLRTGSGDQFVNATLDRLAEPEGDTGNGLQ